MTFNKIVPAFAAAFCLSLTTLAATTETKTETPSKSEAKAGAVLYWYRVSYDNPSLPNGYIKSGEPVYAHDDQTNFDPPCDEGSQRDCLRGFTSAQPSGTNASGLEQIKTDEMP